MMNEYWYKQLREFHSEISETSINDSQINNIIEVHDRLINFSNVARKEGLLALEEAGADLDYNDDFQSYFGQLISLIVDGTDPKDVFSFGMNMIFAMKLSGVDGLMAMMYLHGTLLIQAGYNPHIFDKHIKSYMPPVILNEHIRRDCENALPKALAEAEDDQALIKSYCQDDKTIDEKDHSLVNETAKSLIKLSGKDMQRLLGDTSNSDLAMAMKGLPGKARATIFDNMSPRIAVMVAKDMEYMGPVRMRDVEDSCVCIMKTLLKLSDLCEIQDYDFSILKVIIDMHDAAESENLKLREKYKDLKSIIDKIYSE